MARLTYASGGKMTGKPMIVAGMLGHSISILLTTYAHFFPTLQDQAAKLMDDFLTPIPFELESKS